MPSPHRTESPTHPCPWVKGVNGQADCALQSALVHASRHNVLGHILIQSYGGRACHSISL